LGWQDLQCHQTVEGGLTRLIHRPHAAFAEEAEDLKLREELGHLLECRWHERFGIGSGGSTLLEEAGGAKPGQRARRQRRAALRAFLRHRPIHSGFIHTPTSEANPSKCYRNKCRTCQQARAAVGRLAGAASFDQSKTVSKKLAPDADSGEIDA
jgi:hypothetical protein